MGESYRRAGRRSVAAPRRAKAESAGPSPGSARVDRYLLPIYALRVKVISVHVSERPYAELKSLAASRGVPVAELIRTAMDSFLEGEQSAAGSVLDLAPLHGGRQL